MGEEGSLVPVSVPARGGFAGNHAWAPLERVTCPGTSWDLAPARVTGRQGTAARSPRAVGSGDARDRPHNGPRRTRLRLRPRPPKNPVRTRPSPGATGEFGPPPLRPERLPSHGRKVMQIT
ncbi:hypothetical protein GCM10010232_41310 [Streptomyces amakusaensis]